MSKKNFSRFYSMFLNYVKCRTILGLTKKSDPQSQSKWLGHFGVSLSPQCWCTRFCDQTVINNFERDEGSTRREKTAFG